ncbi:ABC transporter ATP-binding protein/permease [Sphingobium sp. H39-3-25]|uniref:ABC transporter ATP-binding protein/permease n=1 Tax=Sphingobium arseniciresistens TaxID=3030834 RepID=UPI0023B9EB4D|nr:ABC transporter ATP-binding protein/permease [Sphingobium arseniciresistens]
MLRIARIYWLSRDWKFAWFGLIVLTALQFGTASIFFYSNRWQQAFFDSIGERDVARFYPLIGVFIILIALQVGVQIANSWLDMKVSIGWRSALTDHYLGRWMKDNRFAEIERLRLIDNPDQRIAEDIAIVTGNALNSGGLLQIFLVMLAAIASAVGYGIILMETAEPIRFPLLGYPISIPGSTIWYAALYAIIGSVVITKVGRPLIRATMEWQHREANFRANLIHVRRNAPQIGLVGAVSTEDSALRLSFEHVRHIYKRVIYTTLGVRAVQDVYQVIRPVIPLFVLVPRYFAGTISLGQVMAGRDAFQQFANQLSFFVQIYPSLTGQLACLNRLAALDDALDLRRAHGIEMLSRSNQDGVVMQTQDLALFRPNGAPLLEVGDWTVRSGERWLIRGASGVGKTTLLRAIAGLWPEGRGNVAMERDGLMMFVPQRLYLPLGTLKAAICFPDTTEAHSDAEILDLLNRVGLSSHAEHLDVARMWQEELSPGEQQRVALARILLHRPSVVVMDEATSALDPENVRRFHEEILALSSATTLISVGHDEALAQFHTHQLTVREGQVSTGPIAEPANH